VPFDRAASIVAKEARYVESLGKHPDAIIQTQQPLNLEAPLGPLRQSFVTPKELFYVRNHGTLPEVDPSSYRLEVSGLVERPLRLSLEELRNELPKSTVTSAMQCAGNRRQGLIEVSQIPEIPWDAGAVSNARWSGVPLKEVLLTAGVKEEARHVAFAGLDEPGEGWSPNYGSSIPIEKGASQEVLLAYEMNDEPLAPEHGFPLRAVVPGYIGARSVKWLSDITLQDAPSDNYFQAQEYKLFPPYVTEETVDYSEGLMLGEISVNAVICRPSDGASVSAGSVPIQGYAIAGGGRRVERVDLSTDEGRTWTGADLLEGEDEPWAWRFWEANLELDPGRHQVVARALDSAADTQPEDAGSIWNFKGYVNNAWHKVGVNAR
jgi:sulfite oxidase